MKPTIKGVYVDHRVPASFYGHTKIVRVLMWQDHENGELFYRPQDAIISAKKKLNLIITKILKSKLRKKRCKKSAK
jgi:hypothetical protein